MLRAHERGEAEAEDSRSSWVALNHERVRRASTELLRHREGLTADDEADEWLNDLGELLDEPVSPTCEAGIITHLRFAVEEIDRVAEEVDEMPARTPEARVALKTVRRLIGGYRRRNDP
ncbi:hypothetical protein [Streptomyces sp. NPDC006384]|uniref:hypothetical protein n=1 Tax=Streptomyces sp. NPDC006384 TaxID=3364745 RepID=UPI0036BED82B